jgi:predicted dehydrogenase
MSPIYNVLIIGAGKIGAFFDTPKSDQVLTHAHAFSDLNKFNLIGFVDADLQKAQNAANLWNTRKFKSVDDAFSAYIIDVVCVAASTEFHYQVLKELSGFSFKLAFVEKPFVALLHQAEEIKALYEERKISIAVNYSRRFVPEFEILGDKIRQGIYGEFIAGSGYYGKGILNNGSHMIDVIRYFLGEIDFCETISSCFDAYKNDPSVSAVVTLMAEKKIVLQCLNCNFYTQFELDLFFEKARIRIVDSGLRIEEYDVKESEMFSGYKSLYKTSEYYTHLSKSLYYAAVNIHNYLTYNEKIKCGIADGIETLKICTSIAGSVLDNEARENPTFFSGSRGCKHTNSPH